MKPIEKGLSQECSTIFKRKIGLNCFQKLDIFDFYSFRNNIQKLQYCEK